MLRIIAFTIPLSSVHACINGYFLGIQKTGVPAATQLLEQIARVVCVMGITSYATSKGLSPTLEVAVWGLLVGELLSMSASIIAVYMRFYKERSHSPFTRARSIVKTKSMMPIHAYSPMLLHESISPDYTDTRHMTELSNIDTAPYRTKAPHILTISRMTATSYRKLMGFTLPLTANRIVLNLLHSVEAISIPACLRLFGYDTTTSLRVYGVLTGMAMPMIFFPNALTGSISVMLLPHISKSYAAKDHDGVKKTIKRTIAYCSLMGFVCMVGFLFLGRWMGETLFHSDLAGHFILTLSFLCPFMYLNTTLSSIIQGLGMAGRLFVMNTVCLVLRLGFIFFAVPIVGISGYLWGILASQILLTLLFLLCLRLRRR
jgi:stage V sporulation protein B